MLLLFLLSRKDARRIKSIRFYSNNRTIRNRKILEIYRIFYFTVLALPFVIKVGFDTINEPSGVSW